ncbi:MAG TPA: glycyl-radical enzyme activating protein [Candidatus Cryosericum sp.]|nr:glycyl-radical enzyme activating protein [Candidatus Cryosericum sp.]HPS70367.1 glycyl-radical enzyme activating protein [Candidatus Cryosericum sp.]
MEGTVFNIMHYALHDGPGIRTVVFLKGCPLSCLWCHNPEGQAPGPELMLLTDRCTGCGDCVRVCPQGAATLVDGVPGITEACTACGQCVEACVQGARTLAGTRMSVTDVLGELLRDRVFMEGSGGGVTISGGEPLLQAAFLRELVDACEGERMPVAVETCGVGDSKDLLWLAQKGVLFLYDIKLVDEARHRQWTGHGNAGILTNLRTLAQARAHVVVRLPVIPGANDDDANVGQLAGLMRDLGLRRLDLLPYHRIGTEKYVRLGREYSLPELRPPSTEQLERLQAMFEAAGLEVVTGG